MEPQGQHALLYQPIPTPTAMDSFHPIKLGCGCEMQIFWNGETAAFVDHVRFQCEDHTRRGVDAEIRRQRAEIV